MVLFDVIDAEKTKEAVKNKLSNYFLLKSIAGEHYSSKVTATFSFEPRSNTGAVSNPMESHVVRQLTALKKVEEMEKAIDSIHDAYLRQVLVERYCNRSNRNKSDIEIYIDLGMDETHYYRLMNSALISFAETFRNGELLVFANGGSVDTFLTEN